MPEPNSIPDELSGTVFGRLTVVGREHPTSRRFMLCKCQCGKFKTFRRWQLENGKAKSCRCLSVELSKARFTTHGMSRSHEYEVWSSLKKRCLNPDHKQYADYGGRGIKVCKRWQGKNGFANFFADMGSCPNGLEVDRKNNDGHYEPGNCHWTTDKDNSRNKRNNRNVTCDGVTQCISAWSEELGVDRRVLRMRMARMGDCEAIRRTRIAGTGRLYKRMR